MAQLIRFGVAMEAGLLDRYDALIAARGYANRSEALRDLVRRELDADAWQRGQQTCATVTIVYDHHVRELVERLTEIQHDHGKYIISTLHVHLDHSHCMEVIAAKGPARALKAMADKLIGTRGVVSGNIVAAALPPADAR
ncbi:MAG: nickel-responsive transcriptional regulator NikR [Sorangiineae bacterium]|nr:nickel-responsive transcriptional regulator NikR [Polyangiaceae bacterium]MEB2324792.1 nickel-responsive transcriptional regulator NikR [Sorangiineae bacterium]